MLRRLSKIIQSIEDPGKEARSKWTSAVLYVLFALYSPGLLTSSIGLIP